MFLPPIPQSSQCTMGYSLLTDVDGTEWRYTEWVDFNTKVSGAPDWDRVVGRELYNHATDPMENVNVAAISGNEDLLKTLSALLKKHPVAGL